MAEKKFTPRPRVLPKSGFEHLFTNGMSMFQSASSRRVGVVTVEWVRKTQPSCYTQERAFRILARHAGVLQRELGPAWMVFLGTTYDEAREGEDG